MITKDNVKEYQIKCYASNTYEDRMKVIHIIESFGQKVYPTSNFKDKYFREDDSVTFHIDRDNIWYYTNKKKLKGRPRKSVTELGLKQTARIAARRAIKDTVTSNVTNPAAKLVLIAGLGALVTYFLNKK